MLWVISLLFTIQSFSHAKTLRVIHLNESDMATVHVSPGYSTLIKFNSHPEPGLIGDQDSFKVEYMRNMVAIKPLASKGKTNLFLFTKEGQFNFQLIIGKGNHDDIVYAQKTIEKPIVKNVTVNKVTLIDDLMTRKINKTSTTSGIILKVDSVASPLSRSTVIIRFSVEQQNSVSKLDRGQIMLNQGKQAVAIENIFLESTTQQANRTETKGLLLLRADHLKKNEPLELRILPVGGATANKTVPCISFSVDFNRR